MSSITKRAIKVFEVEGTNGVTVAIYYDANYGARSETDQPKAWMDRPALRWPRSSQRPRVWREWLRDLQEAVADGEAKVLHDSVPAGF